MSITEGKLPIGSEEPATNAGVVISVQPREALGRAGGAVSFVDNGGLVLSNVHVQLIFWGLAWAQNPTPSIGDVTNAVQKILAGPYMSALNQYRNIGPGTLKGVTLASTQIGTAQANPPNPFSDGDVQNLISNLINAGDMPGPASDSQILYCVIMPPNVSASGGFIGEHTYFNYAGTNAHYAWVMNNGTLNFVTSIFSHELVESCTDPEGTAILGTAGTCNQPGWCEIGDVCEGNDGVVDGVTVQTYWSQRDNACVLSDEKYVQDTKGSKDTKDNKDSKDNKEHKETKDHKDTKDHKELKEGAKEKDKDAKEKELERLPQDLTSMVSQISQNVDEIKQRMGEIEQQLATGKAFIRPEERPEVGGQALNQPSGGEE